MLSVCSLISSAKELRKTEVISDGDRGLALEWVIDGDVASVYSMCNDEYGDIYLLSSKGGYCSISKYSNNGELIWKKMLRHEISNEQVFDIHSQIFYRDKKIYACFYVNDYDLYYDNVLINKKHGAFLRDILMEVSAEDGSFFNCIEMNNFFPGEGTHLYVTEKGEKIINTIITDGEYQPEGYTILYPEFTGMDDDKYKSEVRTRGKTDYYFAKFDKENNLVWDFALGGEGADERYPLDRSFNGDTMFVCMSFESDSIDIDPDPAHEVWVYGKRLIWNYDNMGILLIQYNISGDKPVLMSYKEIEYTWFAVYHYIYSHPQKGTYMAVENPDYRIERNGYIYQKSGDSRMYARVDDKCNITPLDSIPTSNGLNEGWLYYQYDEEENLYVPNSRINFSRGDSLPIVLNFTKDHKEYISNEIDTWHTSVSKFDRKGNYLWSIMMKSILSGNMYCSSNFGCVIFESAVVNKNKYKVDCNPNPNQETVPTAEHTFLHKYRETYRIAAEPSDHGEVIVPDTFAWHGEDYEIGIIAEKGYKLKSLTANGEEIMPDADGKYYVRNVREPLCINSKFTEITGVDDSKMEHVDITPNVVFKYLDLSNLSGYDRYVIYDMQGKEQMNGDFEENVNVQQLNCGKYQILLQGKRIEKVGIFFKK